MRGETGPETNLRTRVAVLLCGATMLGALLAGCGNSPELNTTGGTVGTTTSGAERTESDGGKTGGTPNTHIDKSGDAGKEGGG